MPSGARDSMAKLLIDISHAPFGCENTFAGLYVASASLSKGHEVAVILSGDGVYAGMKGQLDPQGGICLPSTEEQVKDIIEAGGRVFAVREALGLRGIGAGSLIGGIEVVGMEQAHDMALGHDGHVIEF